MKTKEKSYLFLAVLIFFAVWCLVGRFGLFASNGDWLSQHSVIPEYFRRQFYATGQIFPEFAAGLGAGCNIYDFSCFPWHISQPPLPGRPARLRILRLSRQTPAFPVFAAFRAGNTGVFCEYQYDNLSQIFP